MFSREFLDVSGNHKGRHVPEDPYAPHLAPHAEPRYRVGVGRARILVPDVGREELDISTPRIFTAVKDQGGECLCERTFDGTIYVVCR